MSLPRISEAEWDVMEILWKEQPLSAQEVVARLARTHDWKDQTIRTMLGRLVKKGALRTRAEGNRFHYSTKVAREACVKNASRSLLERLFGDAVQPLLIQLVKESHLSPGEIKELKDILQQKEGMNRRKK
ncbi:MAG: BlaI/MecI/CopY family transcriptional regulator [Blastochloris sp.]|nr:BlaI/MecI/CopY family transcriptional regulator [Blastochloris sp.]